MENVKLFFSNKVDRDERITLREEDKVVSKSNELAEAYKSYFETIVENLGINEELLSCESVTDIMMKFQNHPSIIKIKENHQGHISFPAVELKAANWKINSPDVSKVIQQNDMQVKIIKTIRDTYSA